MMNNPMVLQQNNLQSSFFEEMVAMEKELPLEMQVLIYQKVKKMKALSLAHQFDNENFDFQIDENMFDDLLEQIANND